MIRNLGENLRKLVVLGFIINSSLKFTKHNYYEVRDKIFPFYWNVCQQNLRRFEFGLIFSGYFFKIVVFEISKQLRES